MIKSKLSLIITVIVCLGTSIRLSAQNFLVENKVNPIGIDVKTPQFSWQLISDKRNVVQTAYEIRVSDNLQDLLKNKNLVWNSGKVLSDSSVHVLYKGRELQSNTKYYWQVRTWTNKSKSALWSQPASWKMALLKTSDWKAEWIGPGFIEDSIMRPSPLFRKEFSVEKKVVSATAYITAHGLYVAMINGQRIGDAYLTPGWTSYKNRLQYQAYDVTNLLKNGTNAVGAILGNGWYRGVIGFSNNINVYGKDIALLLQINITYSDGSTGFVLSDGSWKSSTGGIRYDEIYNGETDDARDEKTGWTLPGYDDAKWSGVTVAGYPKDIL
ncbi:MAG TPA: alpha-L-rhamnosidase N-terminal domain-containing protein, partial [Ginsengibacter sp.]|nr:alpha-L-rhamnosidase N-terminal domain-containing protein [Ginsengibacter sp.]